MNFQSECYKKASRFGGSLWREKRPAGCWSYLVQLRTENRINELEMGLFSKSRALHPFSSKFDLKLWYFKATYHLEATVCIKNMHSYSYSRQIFAKDLNGWNTSKSSKVHFITEDVWMHMTEFCSISLQSEFQLIISNITFITLSIS